MDYPLQAAQRVSLTARIAQHLSTHHTDLPCRADPVHSFSTGGGEAVKHGAKSQAHHELVWARCRNV